MLQTYPQEYMFKKRKSLLVNENNLLNWNSFLYFFIK